MRSRSSDDHGSAHPDGGERSVGIPLPAGVRAGVAAAVRALARPLGVPAVVLAVGAVAAALAGAVVVAHGLSIAVLALASLAIHELGHVLALRSVAPASTARLVVRALGAALVRERLDPRRDRIVTAAGPLAPSVLLPFGAAALPWLPAESAALLLIAVGHLLALALPSADRSAWRAAGEVRRAHGRLSRARRDGSGGRPGRPPPTAQPELPREQV